MLRLHCLLYKTFLAPDIPLKPERYLYLLHFRRGQIGGNRKFALTSVPDNQIFDRLILPSAWLGLQYAGEKVGVVADFGSGAGIPGLAMAIIDGNNRYHLYDSNRKKIGFIRHCLAIPDLIGDGRVEIFPVRVNRDSSIDLADRLICRAAGDMREVIRLWSGKIQHGGVADFFKGDDAEEEIKGLLELYPSASFRILDSPAWFGNLRIVRSTDIF